MLYCSVLWLVLRIHVNEHLLVTSVVTSEDLILRPWRLVWKRCRPYVLRCIGPVEILFVALEVGPHFIVIVEVCESL